MDKAHQMPLGDDLMVGAETIAEFMYGDRRRVRDIYRNPGNLSFFKLGNAVAAFKSTIRAELIEAQRTARQKRQAASANTTEAA
jgi:hypothetical protein